MSISLCRSKHTHAKLNFTLGMNALFSQSSFAHKFPNHLICSLIEKYPCPLANVVFILSCNVKRTEQHLDWNRNGCCEAKTRCTAKLCALYFQQIYELRVLFITLFVALFIWMHLRAQTLVLRRKSSKQNETNSRVYIDLFMFKIIHEQKWRKKKIENKW